MITVNIDDNDAKKELQRVAQAGANMRPLYLSIGEQLTNSTQERFRTSTAPDGSQWQQNAQSTYLALINKKDQRKDGALNQRGINKVLNKQPLIGELGWNGGLADQIYYQTDEHGVSIGSPKPYAAMQQFGGTQQQFPHLWADIPARPYLGLSDEDNDDILAMALDHLANSA